jgi:hypothetical protein
MAPNPRCVLSCVSGSEGFCPACIVGSCWGVEELPVDGAAPLTM